MKLRDYIGQENIKDDLRIHITNAQVTGYPLEHIILYGRAGLGKTTLAEIVAEEMKVEIIQKIGQEFNKEVLYTILNVIQFDEILFIDEIHNTPVKVMEVLYGPLQIINNMKVRRDGVKKLEFQDVEFSPFTLIGATTAPGMVSKPLRDRMILNYQLEPYTVKELTKLLSLQGCPNKPAEFIAKRSRGTPRIALNYFIRIRNEALGKEIKLTDCVKTFARNKVDDNGFLREDIRILKYLFENHTASEAEIYKSLGIDKSDFQTMYEAFLLEEGMIKITSKGRGLTKRGTEYAKNTSL